MNYVFDTHAFVKAFISAKTEEEKAEVIAKTISEAKQDATVVVKAKFDETKNELATKNDVSALKSDIKALELATKNDVSALKSDIKALELSTKRDLSELKVEMLKWMFGMLAGQLTLIILILKVFFKGAGGF